MDPQKLVPIGAVVAFLAGLAASRGLITKEQAAYLASPETLAFFGTVIGAVVAAVGWWKSRPPAVVKAAANIVAKEGGVVIAGPTMANETLAKVPNVVATVQEAQAKVSPPATE